MRQVYCLLGKQFAIILSLYCCLLAVPGWIIYIALFLGTTTIMSIAGTVLATAVILIIFGSIADFCAGPLREKLIQAKIMDNPNLRSMHIQPVPRGGGWIFVLASSAFLLLAALLNDYSSLAYTSGLQNSIFRAPTLLIGYIGLAAISWLDDCKNIPARWRLLAQILATAPVAYFMLPDLQLQLPIWVSGSVAFGAAVFVWVGFINLYNFMDGIDGITATQTISIGFPIYLVFMPLHGLIAQTAPPPLVLASLLGLMASGLSLGFFYHNWHPAKIFLGDVGSVTIGYLMGFCLVSVISAGYWYVALTLPLYYFADGGITLLRRLLKGEKIWEAHRTHFYQRAAQAAGRHDVVVLKIAACNAVLTVIAVLELLYSPWLVLAAPLPVAWLLHNMAYQRHIGRVKTT